MVKFTKILMPRNGLATLTLEETKDKFFDDCKKRDPAIKIYFANSDERKMCQKDWQKFRPEFIGGLWRAQETPAQKEFDFIEARREKFIVLSKLPEKLNNFTYYAARKLPLITYCYGISKIEPDCFLANLHTHWGYGKTIEEASAYLSRKLADVYRHVIDGAIAREKTKIK